MKSKCFAMALALLVIPILTLSGCKRADADPQQGAPPAANVVPFEELQTRYYLRLMAKDQPGVLAQVTAALGAHGISLSAILQRETDAGQFVPIVITTHLAREGAMQAALRQIEDLWGGGV